jgi:predicted metal-dependent enzyme (double-stranded beta helix superfamily)
MGNRRTGAKLPRMAQTAGAPIQQLAESLARVRTGEGAAQEVVRWLRAVADTVTSIPAPSKRNAHRQYTRTLLHRCDDFEILVLHWLPNCASAIHDHGGARCWLALASGTMNIENYTRCDAGTTAGYARIVPDSREVLQAGAIDHRQDDIHLHRCATGSEPAISLHVYAHPIDRFNTFDERSERCTEVTSCYDAVLA